LGEKWRKPRGIHSKMRRHYGYRPPIVSIGYRGPKDVRGYHPSGFKEVMVHNPAQLEKMDPKTQAARVGGTVGYKKKLAIEKRADELGIRVLNRTG
jgi:large subunit ribosomal protein L32e